MRAAVITLSDSGYAGRREDKSGPVIRALAEAAGYEIVHTALLPDGVEPLAAELRRLCDGELADLILKLALERKYGKVELPPLADEFETAAHNYMEARLSRK